MSIYKSTILLQFSNGHGAARPLPNPTGSTDREAALPRPPLPVSTVPWRRMANIMECEIVWGPMIVAAIKHSTLIQLQLILRKMSSVVKSFFIFWLSFRLSKGFNFKLATTKKLGQDVGHI